MELNVSPSGRYWPVLSGVVAPVTAGSASVPLLLLVKLFLGPAPRSATATRSVSRTPFPVASVSPVVSAKCLRSNVPLLRMLLLPPTSCTKPVILPLLMMLVLLLEKNGLLATARSDSAPMLPLLVRVAVPPDEPRITPAAGSPLTSPTLVRSACHPPITDPPDATLTATLPPAVALIAAPNCPMVSTSVALTVTVAGCGPVKKNPLSALIPIALEPSVVLIGPKELMVILPPPEKAAMPLPFPPLVVMPGPV